MVSLNNYKNNTAPHGKHSLLCSSLKFGGPNIKRLQRFGCCKAWYYWLVLGSQVFGPQCLSVEYLAFHFVNHAFPTIYVDLFFGNFNRVTWNVFNNIVKEIKTCLGKRIKISQLLIYLSQFPWIFEVFWLNIWSSIWFNFENKFYIQ
jgi:hypothetical protein